MTVKAFTLEELWQGILIYSLLGYIIFQLPNTCQHASNCARTPSKTSDGIIEDSAEHHKQSKSKRSYEIEAHGDDSSSSHNLE